MKTGILTAFFLVAAVPVVAQTGASRANLQQSLGFEDQTNTSLTGWRAGPASTVSADNSVAHTGHWSVRLQRDTQSAGAFSVIYRSLPFDFQGSTLELRGYMKLQNVSDSAVSGSSRRQTARRSRIKTCRRSK